MSDFSFDIVMQALNDRPAKSAGGGRALMFIAAQRGIGVTTAVRAAAHAAAQRTVYAIDLDLRRNALAKGFAEEGEPLGPKIDCRLSGANFYRLVGADGQVIDERSPACGYHRVGRSRIHVCAFDARALPKGGRVLIESGQQYWNAARAGGAVAIIDAPALERSQVGLRIARHVDGVVLVVGDEDGAAPAAMAAKTGILAAGGHLLGLVYARAAAHASAIDRMLTRA